MRAVFHPAADAELTEATAYYAEIDPQLGERFHSEMVRLIREICSHPKKFRQFALRHEGISVWRFRMESS